MNEFFPFIKKIKKKFKKFKKKQKSIKTIFRFVLITSTCFVFLTKFLLTPTLIFKKKNHKKKIDKIKYNSGEKFPKHNAAKNNKIILIKYTKN